MQQSTRSYLLSSQSSALLPEIVTAERRRTTGKERQRRGRKHEDPAELTFVYRPLFYCCVSSELWLERVCHCCKNMQKATVKKVSIQYVFAGKIPTSVFLGWSTDLLSLGSFFSVNWTHRPVIGLNIKTPQRKWASLGILKKDTQIL